VSCRRAGAVAGMGGTMSLGSYLDSTAMTMLLVVNECSELIYSGKTC